MTCLFCSGSNPCHYCETDHTPDWFTAGKSTPKLFVNNVAKGLHPLGARLSDVKTATCGNCKHMLKRSFSGTYYKCGKHTANTAGAATDIRRKWKGCELWEATAPPDDYKESFT